MNLQERLQIFYERLRAAPPVANAREALDLICRLIVEVEDEFSGTPRLDPPPKRATGRMYPPLPDRITGLADGSLAVETRRHAIRLSADGGIRIARAGTSDIEFSKAGRKV